MELKSQNLGEWSAVASNEPGKTPQLKVNGTFPANEKPLYSLEKKSPQGISASELILELKFGTLVDPNATSTKTVFGSFALSTVDDFVTVLVVDADNRTIANINIEKA